MGLDTIRQIDRLDATAGGRFHLTALIQKRIQDIVRGSPVIINAATPLRSALAEIEAGKIEFQDDAAADELLG